MAQQAWTDAALGEIAVNEIAARRERAAGIVAEPLLAADGTEIERTTRVDGDRVLDMHERCFVGWLREVPRPAELGGPRSEWQLHNSMVGTWIGWTRDEAVEVLDRIASIAHGRGVSTQSLLLTFYNRAPLLDCGHCGERREDPTDVNAKCERCGMRPDGTVECDGCGELIPKGLDMRRGDDGERLCAVCGDHCEPA